ncbi:TPA: hypothetical protein ACFNMW_001662 [Neisseria lactamica]|uniref:hypothetical protein n=1 Tax=Neisseria lactamica TaxID=486 RepID=UPI00186466AF|nr:hypothetical protein [Neisseria lactamica]
MNLRKFPIIDKAEKSFYCSLILWVSKPGGAETLQKCRLKLEIGFRRHWFMRQVGA